MNILTLNLVFMTFVFAVAAKIYILPKLNVLEPRSVLLPILLLHSMRHLGMMFLAPGAVYAGMPQEFAKPDAYGDLLTAVLALIAIWALLRNFSKAGYLLWVFNVVGTVDLLTAIFRAAKYHATEFLGPSYWIPAFWVPALLVTHYIVFVILLKAPNEASSSISANGILPEA